MQTVEGKFSFKVPAGHPEAGNKIEKSFTFEQCETDQEAVKYLGEKQINLKDLVNDLLKGNARANAYQTAVTVYRPSTVSEEDIVERMVRDMIRLGKSEEDARKIVAASFS